MAKERNHPKGLTVLFFTELWERFGFYLMLGIFTLYMVEGKGETFPGLGLSNDRAADIYGTYLALVYLTPFFGGLIADRILGYRRSIFIGGSLMAIGYLGLSIPESISAFYISLLLIILGNGMFKPNISALLGKLYETEQFKDKKDAGFNIFYMGINIGAFFCNFVAAYLRLEYGWGWAFAAAGIGMIVGLIWFAFGNKMAPEIKKADKISPAHEGDTPMSRILTHLFIPAAVAGLVGWFIPSNVFGSDSTDGFIFFSLPVVLFYINLWRKADKSEKEPIAALLAVMGCVVVFWAVFHQNGSALTYWAKYNTDREMLPVIEKPLETLKLVEEVSTVPREFEVYDAHGKLLESSVGSSYYFSNFSGALPVGNTVDYPPVDMITKYKSAAIVQKFGDPDKVENQEQWRLLNEGEQKNLILAQWNTIPETERKEYGKLRVIPTELQASINPFYVIILTPLVVGFFAFLRRRKKEPTTPAKIFYGLLITALSMLVMFVAAKVSGSGDIKASFGWLFGVYGVITIGELCLSPMGLSLVSKLSPKRIVALMMGGWFLSTAIGNKLSGVLSGLWDVFDKKEYFFLTNTLLTLVAVVGILLILPWLNRVVREHTSEA